jgi:hypothetical protein
VFSLLMPKEENADQKCKTTPTVQVMLKAKW